MLAFRYPAKQMNNLLFETTNFNHKVEDKIFLNLTTFTHFFNGVGL